MKFNLENGKIGEFAVEGLDTRSPAGPVKVGRFALKSLDLSGFLRVAALFSNPAQRPAPDQLLGLFPLIAGVEVKGFVAPFKNTNKLVTLDSFRSELGPVCRTGTEPGAPDREDDHAGRSRTTRQRDC